MFTIICHAKCINGSAHLFYQKRSLTYWTNHKSVEILTLMNQTHFEGNINLHKIADVLVTWNTHWLHNPSIDARLNRDPLQKKDG